MRKSESYRWLYIYVFRVTISQLSAKTIYKNTQVPDTQNWLKTSRNYHIAATRIAFIAQTISIISTNNNEFFRNPFSCWTWIPTKQKIKLSKKSKHQLFLSESSLNQKPCQVPKTSNPGAHRTQPSELITDTCAGGQPYEGIHSRTGGQ